MLAIFASAKAYDYYPTKLKPTGSLPVLYINVYDEGTKDYNNEIIDINLAHKEYFPGEYWLDLNGCKWLEELGAESIGSKEEPLPLQIKARGNYTRTHFCKKPFKIKLDKKQNMLGLTPEKSKHYALLAHGDDSKGFLRNFTGFELGRRIGLGWSPRQQAIELVINGDYRGLYFLTESIRVGNGRIMIEELNDNETDPALISGGYVVELDNHPEGDYISLKEKSCVKNDDAGDIEISFDSPEEYSDIQKRFVTEQFTQINNYIGANNDKLWKYLDLDDAARYFIVMEMMSHKEAYRGSTYLARDRGEGQKWHFTAVWDFGHGFDSGTTNYIFKDRNKWWHHYWVASLWENKKFQQKVKETWLWFMSERFDGIYEMIDEYVDEITEAAVRDHERWKNVPKPNYPDARSLTDNSNMMWLKWSVTGQMNQKYDWLKQQWGDYSKLSNVPEPERDTTEAAPLPEYAKDTTGIEFTEAEDSSSKPRYFNLQGIEISTPVAGEIYIEQRGNRRMKKIMTR